MASNQRGSTASAKVLRRNAPGNRSDIGWNHGTPVDGDHKKIKCKYCEKVINGGVYRLKHHLACTQKDVGPCRAVPEEVKLQMFDIVVGLQEKLLKKSQTFGGIGSSSMSNSEEIGSESEKGKSMEVDTGNLFKKRCLSSQTTINSIFKKDLREEACQDIASFFYENAIPFNVARTDSFKKMFESVARHGQGFKPPSYHEIRVKYLNQKIESTMEILKEHRAAWKKTGCTIMTDGWTDKKRRTIINFLVNSPKGTIFLKSIDASHISKTADKIFEMIDDVVEDVGEENVVQVISDNAANYKAAGEMLMLKRKKLYWTPCAAHCIDLMLEDFEKKLEIHAETIPKGKRITTYIYSKSSLIPLLHHFTKGKDLIRPAQTRFATSYLTLGCLNDNHGALIRMFTSDQWKNSRFANTKDGKLVEEVVMDKAFWKNIATCLKAAFPLIKVLRLVDSDEKPAMGFIYEEMDRAKELIQTAFGGVKRRYMPIWGIIDARWDAQMHRPLHAAGYYLNPQIHYSEGFQIDYEVKKGLYDCLDRMVGDIETIKLIDFQLEDFKSRAKFFGNRIAQAALETKTSAQWWDSYGDEHPELQRFVIRVLSLTCSSSVCERNWSAFEMVHTKRMNRLQQKTMNDVVFVMANSKLAKKKSTRQVTDYGKCLEDLSSDDEWIVDQDKDSPNNEGIEDLDNVQIEIPNEDDDRENNCGPALDDLAIPIDEDLEADALENVMDEEVEDDYYDHHLNDLL